jgi:hypothetical protein
VRSAVEHIAAFAASARPEHLRSDVSQLFKRNILDSLGCAIAGLQGKPFQALREQFEEYRAAGRCTLIGGGKTSADQAALINSSLIGYVDLLDRYMAVGGLCHPSDNFGTILAAAEQVGASGARRTGFAVEGILPRNDRDARRLRHIARQARFQRSKGLFEGLTDSNSCSDRRSPRIGGIPCSKRCEYSLLRRNGWRH